MRFSLFSRCFSPILSFFCFFIRRELEHTLLIFDFFFSVLFICKKNRRFTEPGSQARRDANKKARKVLGGAWKPSNPAKFRAFYELF
jgi:hypothetical protein